MPCAFFWRRHSAVRTIPVPVGANRRECSAALLAVVEAKQKMKAFLGILPLWGQDKGLLIIWHYKHTTKFK
jgi:hypothetical protein